MTDVLWQSLLAQKALDFLGTLTIGVSHPALWQSLLAQEAFGFLITLTIGVSHPAL